jgi:hypothetical protein
VHEGFLQRQATDQIATVQYCLLTLNIFAEILPCCSLLVHLCSPLILRDDTTCIVLDIKPAEKPKYTIVKSGKVNINIY